MASSIPLYCCRCMPFSNVILRIDFTQSLLQMSFPAFKCHIRLCWLHCLSWWYHIISSYFIFISFVVAIVDGVLSISLFKRELKIPCPEASVSRLSRRVLVARDHFSGYEHSR